MDRQALEKLAPEVRVLLNRREAAQRAKTAGASSLEEGTDTSEQTTVFVAFQGDVAPLEALGFNVTSRTGNIAVGHIALDQIPALAALESVSQIDKPSPPKLALDDSIPDIRADQVWTRNGTDFTGFTGNGVVVAVVDTGIEYTHNAFRHANGTTRISAIWDQTLSPQPGESSPGAIVDPVIGTAALGYGVEFKDQDPNPAVKTLTQALLNANPFSVVRHRDTDGHGTHVAGTAAGNGSQNGNCHGQFHYIGVAPEADLIVVRLRGLTKDDTGMTGQELVDAIHYIFNRANGRPTVVNLSLGSNIGPRDGSTSQEMLLDSILSNIPNGFAIVYAAGNSADEKIHAAQTVTANSTLDLSFHIKAKTNTPVVVDIRFPTGQLDAAVQLPGGTLSAFATSISPIPQVTLPGGSGTADLVVGSTFIGLVIQPTMSGTPPVGSNLPSRDWLVRLRETNGTAVPFNAWINEIKDLDEGGVKVAFLNHIVTASTIDNNAAGANVIVVGAHHPSGKDQGKLAEFSSHGPALRPSTGGAHENIRPHLTAPGTDITAPAIDKFRHDGNDACACCCCVDWYRDVQGTSMAAPHVAGTVALMLEKNPTLTFTQIRDILTTTVRTDGISGALPNNEFGFGRLDAKAAVEAVPAPAPPPAPPPVPVESVRAVKSNGAEAHAGFDPASPVGRLLQTPHGRKWYELGQQHHDEVRTLINTNKRVATVWHRNHGPLIGHHLTRCLLLPHVAMPNEVNGVLVSTALTNMAAIVQRYGSRELSRAVDEALPLALALCGKNFEEAIHFLQQPELTHA
jgi:subtilisin family serine protease